MSVESFVFDHRHTYDGEPDAQTRREFTAHTNGPYDHALVCKLFRDARLSEARASGTAHGGGVSKRKHRRRRSTPPSLRGDEQDDDGGYKTLDDEAPALVATAPPPPKRLKQLELRSLMTKVAVASIIND